MVSPSDKEYIQTKLIIQGQLILEKPFTDLADWINSQFGVKPINIIYDIIEHSNRPRLQVIFEKYDDIKSFKADNGLFDKEDRQDTVKKEFENLTAGFKEYSLNKLTVGFKQYLTKNLLVLFDAFEITAKEEANSKISSEKLDELKAKLSPVGIWEIRRSFSSGIFLFHTNEQVYESKKNGTQDKIKDMYFNLIKECDEFGYLNKSDFYIKFDSKENFDKNYQSNWFYYYQDN